MRAGGCGLPELDLEGEERVGEVGADEALRLTAMQVGRAGFPGQQKRADRPRAARTSVPKHAGDSHLGHGVIDPVGHGIRSEETGKELTSTLVAFRKVGVCIGLPAISSMANRSSRRSRPDDANTVCAAVRSMA